LQQTYINQQLCNFTLQPLKEAQQTVDKAFCSVGTWCCPCILASLQQQHGCGVSCSTGLFYWAFGCHTYWPLPLCMA
jgi:hypothetical protein